MGKRKTNPEKPAVRREGSTPGRLFVISAPSGAGKTTLCRAVRKRFPDMLYSVSYTTRSPRKGEKNAIDYHFISLAEFEKGITENRWTEWAQVHGHYYGTSAEFLDINLAVGRDILLVIDVQGAIQILAKYPDCITIFIEPPSMATLRHRLKLRGLDSEGAIEQRLRNARDEMAQKYHYRHVIINDQLAAAAKDLITLIERYRTG
ncbi:MAG: guanylate kinase [Desulfobacterales bacterium]|jgi:guanylate kinase